MRVVYLSKDNSAGRAGLEVLHRYVVPANTRTWLANPGEKLPPWHDWGCDLLVSYLCPRIIPANILEQCELPINFHPAPPEYPGFGCYNFAIYDGVTEYGVTCHRMVPTVDSGEIYRVRRFDVPQPPTVAGLQERSLEELPRLLEEVMATIADGGELAPAARWQRPPTTRVDFEALRKVPLDGDADEVARRVTAFAHPDFDGAYIRLHGFDFIALPPGRATT